MKLRRLVFVKFGGAAITDKTKPRTPKIKNIESLCHQMAEARRQRPDITFLLGHGSGSFGHFSGQKYNTRNGVRSDADWLGFAEVWEDARQLNELVIHACLEAGLPVIAFPPSAWMVTDNREPILTQIEPIHRALEKDLIPVVNGDVIFDKSIGGTILSTEEVFSLLAENLMPDRIVLCSREPGIWQDFPACTQLASNLSIEQYHALGKTVAGSAGMDVTGGMAKKVSIMMDILKKQPEIGITITSGIDGHSLFDALVDKPTGTLLHS